MARVKSASRVLLAALLIAQLVTVVPAGAVGANYVATGVWPATPQAVYRPGDVAFDGAGNVYVLDTSNSRVKKFSSAGALLATWTLGSGGVSLKKPEAFAVTSAGRVYVADSGNNRIQILEADGAPGTAWGSLGSAQRQFNRPLGIALDAGGNVYVADTFNHRIQKFQADGTYVRQWGTRGSLAGQLDAPRGLAVVGSKVFVADAGNRRIDVFTTDGAISIVSGSVNYWGLYLVTDPTDPGYVANGGAYTTSRYGAPYDVGSDSAGKIYVVDAGKSWIERCTQLGSFEATWGATGSGDGQLWRPAGIGIDPANVAWVADAGNHRIQKLTTAGVWQATWDARETTGQGLNEPEGIAMDSSGNVYVVDTRNNRIQKYDSSGAYVGAIGSSANLNSPRGAAVDAAGSVYVADAGANRIRKFSAAGTLVATYGALGTGDGLYNAPQGVALDVSGNIYVADTGNNRIQVLNSSGGFVRKWGSYGTGTLQFKTPSSIAVQGGYVYVADAENHRISKFNTTGAYQTSWGGYGATNERFTSISGVAVTESGNVLVVDDVLDRLQVFTTAGTFLGVNGSAGAALGQYHGASGVAVLGAEAVISERDGCRFQRLIGDSGPPVTDVSGTPEGWDIGWVNTNVELTLTAEDDGTGVAATYYSLDGGSAIEYQDAPFTVSDEGETTVSYWSIDNGGQEETPHEATVRIDKTDPVTDSNIDGGWHRPPFAVELYPEDSLSGIDITYYQLGGGDPQEYTGSFDVAAEGETLVEWWSVDNAGNTEDVHSGIVRTNSGVPVTSTNANSAWRSTSVTVTFTVDVTPGLGYDTYFKVGDGPVLDYGVSGPYPVTAEGITALQYWSVDELENVEATKTVQIRIDRTPPVTTADAEATYIASATIHLSASDGGSGVQATYYSLDGADPVSGSQLTVTDLGGHQLAYWSVDNVGNAELTQGPITFEVLPIVVDYAPIQGSDRYDTGVLTSLAAFPDGVTELDAEGHRSLVIASGETFPDALAGTGLAGAVNGPVLLTTRNALPSDVSAEIIRLGVDRVFIVGGTAAVDSSVEDTVRNVLGLQVERIFGATRYETAISVAERLIGLVGTDFDGTALVVTGDKFADAISAGPLSAAKGWPLYLVRTNDEGYADTSMQANGVEKIVIVGGTGAVSAAVEAKLEAAVGSAAVRLDGIDRYETAVKAARYGASTGGLGWDNIGIATGEKFPDGLTGGALIGHQDGIMLLTKTNQLSSFVAADLTAHRDEITHVTYFGGPAAISTGVRADIAALLR